MNFIYNIVAAIMFFTKLPLWRFINPDQKYFSRIIYLWSFTGWLTAGTAVVFWYASTLCLPAFTSLVIAFGVRTLLTGALHEDGLADFFDGFGGGRTKADVLRIMKDSNTGSFALIGLIFYYLLLISTLSSLPAKLIPWLIFLADPFSKFVTAMMMNVLPYARNVDESKAKTTFRQLSWVQIVLCAGFGILPIALLPDIRLAIALIAPIICMIAIMTVSKKKIDGYTGDVCGATALLCELAFYLAIMPVIQLFNLSFA